MIFVRECDARIKICCADWMMTLKNVCHGVVLFQKYTNKRKKKSTENDKCLWSHRIEKACKKIAHSHQCGHVRHKVFWSLSTKNLISSICNIFCAIKNDEKHQFNQIIIGKSVNDSNDHKYHLFTLAFSVFHFNFYYFLCVCVCVPLQLISHFVCAGRIHQINGTIAGSICARVLVTQC